LLSVEEEFLHDQLKEQFWGVSALLPVAAINFSPGSWHTSKTPLHRAAGARSAFGDSVPSRGK
jgi:hypothetical protein